MTLPRTAMLFAAGRGTRMRHLTAERPKPMIEVAGRPLIAHALDLLRAAQADRVVVNTHHLPDRIEAYLAGVDGFDIRLSPEADELLETGGGIARARPLLGEGPVLTLNADAAWSDPAAAAAALSDDWPEGPVGARLLLVPRDRAEGHAGPGDFFMDEGGRLTRRGAASAAPFVYAGFQVLDPAPVYAWPARVFSLNPVWDAMIAEGALYGAVYPGRWCDVGRPENIAIAEEMLA